MLVIPSQVIVVFSKYLVEMFILISEPVAFKTYDSLSEVIVTL